MPMFGQNVTEALFPEICTIFKLWCAWELLRRRYVNPETVRIYQLK